MRIYGFDWAASVVDKYLARSENDPRVGLGICYWRYRFNDEFGHSGLEMLRGRLIYHLRRAKISKAWEKLKEAAKDQIQWEPAFKIYLLPTPKQVYSSRIKVDNDLNKPIKSDIDGELFPDYA